MTGRDGTGRDVTRNGTIILQINMHDNLRNPEKSSGKLAIIFSIFFASMQLQVSILPGLELPPPRYPHSQSSTTVIPA